MAKKKNHTLDYNNQHSHPRFRKKKVWIPKEMKAATENAEFEY